MLRELFLLNMVCADRCPEYAIHVIVTEQKVKCGGRGPRAVDHPK